MKNDETIVHFNGRFTAKKDVRISPDDRGFLLADGVYEVIRSYGGKMFRIEDHLGRLARSLREVRIELPDVQDLGNVARELIQANDRGDREATVYIQITRGTAPRTHPFPEATSPTIYVSSSPYLPPEEKWEHGIGAILTPDIRWTRCDIKSLALLPNVLASQRAREAGAGEALFVRDGAITEGSHTNFCAVFDGELWTYPRSPYILAGITRQVVLDLCGELGIPFREYPVLESRLPQAEELLVIGTTSEITPIVRVDHRPVGDGKPGPITRKLQQAFRRVARE